ASPPSLLPCARPAPAPRRRPRSIPTAKRSEALESSSSTWAHSPATPCGLPLRRRAHSNYSPLPPQPSAEHSNYSANRCPSSSRSQNNSAHQAKAPGGGGNTYLKGSNFGLGLQAVQRDVRYRHLRVPLQSAAVGNRDSRHRVAQ